MPFGFLGSLTAILAALNFYVYSKARLLLPGRRRWVWTWFAVINAPIVYLIAVPASGGSLNLASPAVLKVVVYPFMAWVAAVMAFFLLAVPTDVAMSLTPATRRMNRRGWLAAVTPVLYGIGLKGVYGPHDLDVAPMLTVRIPNLPTAFEGMTITQVSDLHTGSYIRRPELDRVVDAVNGLRGDIIVVTGDFMDNSLVLLDVARESLRHLRAPMGVYGNLGNHDYYADRPRAGYPGCVAIIEAMQAAGIHMLRNAHTVLPGGMVLGGVDWTSRTSGNPNSYDSPVTRRALDRTFAGADPRMPRLLLAHHPHVFLDSPDYGVALTLAGHTHGGGQVVFAERDGHPVAIGSWVYKFVSGLYRQGEHVLYVNRGIGYVGLPIRINCPPEISRFRLTRA